MKQVFWSLWGFWALILCSCSSSQGTSADFDVELYPSKDLVETFGYYPSFEVDVVGTSAEDAIKLSTYSLDRYFESGSKLRKFFEPVTFRFSDKDLEVKRFRADSPEYAHLMGKSPEFLAVIVNLPGEGQGSEDKDKAEPTALDPRKFIYKIPVGFFSDQPDLFLKITSSGVIRTTQEDAQQSIPSAPESDQQPRQVELSCKSTDNQKGMTCVEVVPKVKGSPEPTID